MAGECISYGAFGAYSTEYNRSLRPRTTSPTFERGRQKTRSWTNFLPDVQPSVVAHKEAVKSSLYREGYDHEYHAGIKDTKPEVAWVVKRYFPLDERTYAPVPRNKYMIKSSGVPPPQHWIPPKLDSDPELSKFTRGRPEAVHYSTTPYTRDESWSTLREMLPSTGRPMRVHPPDWGNKASRAPSMTAQPQRRFPIVGSPMSRFVSDMHLSNREFRLF